LLDLKFRFFDSFADRTISLSQGKFAFGLGSRRVRSAEVLITERNSPLRPAGTPVVISVLSSHLGRERILWRVRPVMSCCFCSIWGRECRSGIERLLPLAKLPFLSLIAYRFGDLAPCQQSAGNLI